MKPLKHLILLALIFICSARACAQDLPDHPRPKTLNRIELSLAGLSLAADGFTTEKDNRPHWKDYNPVINNFVHGPKSNAVYFSAMFGGLIYSNRLLRNHPRMRHGLNWSVIAVESYCTYHNAMLPRKIVR